MNWQYDFPSSKYIPLCFGKSINLYCCISMNNVMNKKEDILIKPYEIYTTETRVKWYRFNKCSSIPRPRGGWEGVRPGRNI